MAKIQRQQMMAKIEELRGGRKLICFFNFYRESFPPLREVCDTSFRVDAKEALFRVLKESTKKGEKIDLCLYTRGGSIDAVWPTVSLLRQFDPDFEVLVPFRCHSAGTLLCLGAKKVLMTPLAELGPIDPSVGNEFNPIVGNEFAPICVEDVRAYRDFLAQQIKFGKEETGCQNLEQAFPVFLGKLVEQVHPLALGNVHRSQLQILSLAQKLLTFHPIEKAADAIASKLVKDFYSHAHGINIEEAQMIIGSQKVEAASDELSAALDELLREYESNFELRKPFFVDRFLDTGYDPLFWRCVEEFLNGKKKAEVEAFAARDGKLSEPRLSKANLLRKVEEAEQFVRTGTGEREARLIGGAIESRKWSYLFETKISMGRYSEIPPHINVQLTPGGGLPLVPGLPTGYALTLHSMAWVRNKGPKGVSL